MNFPSSNTDNANPSLNDIVSNISSSHGVRLTGGSTGGIVEPVGDDANISLRVRGKGTGGVILGNSSSPVTFGAGAVPLKGWFTQNSTYSHAAIAVDRQVVLTFASTTVDINAGDLLSVGLTVDTADQSSVVGVAWWRLSTVATSRLTISLFNQASTATSTGSGTFHLAWFDLT